MGGYLFVTFATSLRGEIGPIDSVTRFVLGFFMGGALYLFADKIRLRFAIVLLLGLVALAWRSGPRSLMG